MTVELSKIKLTHNVFEYYVLHIKSVNNNNLLEDKLKSFSLSNNKSEYLIVKFDDAIPIEDIEKIASHIINLCEELKLDIYAFDIPVSHGIGILFGINIINLPSKTIKQTIIYNKPLTINEPIRSGARVFNNGDVIVTNFVSNGAEVVATGNIHIYGELKGRAVAGCDGNEDSKIFIHKFNPELVSISGYYKVFDDKLINDLYNQSVMVELNKNKKINITKIT